MRNIVVYRWQVTVQETLLFTLTLSLRVEHIKVDKMIKTYKTKLSSPFVNMTANNRWLTWGSHGCLFDCNNNNTHMATAATKKQIFCTFSN